MVPAEYPDQAPVPPASIPPSAGRRVASGRALPGHTSPFAGAVRAGKPAAPNASGLHASAWLMSGREEW